MSASPLVAVVGASGGLGASTLACGIAVAGHRRGLETVVVDARAGSRGLLVTAGVEHEPGLRWDDLAQAQGEINGDRLLSVLPRVPDGPPVLSGSGLHYGPIPSSATRLATFGSLTRVRDLVLADLPVDELDDVEPLHPYVLLLAGEDATRVADLDVAAARLGARVRGRVALVVRGAVRHHHLHQELADDIGLPLLGSWGSDRRLQADRRRGLAPGGSLQVRRLTDALIALLGDPAFGGM